MLFRQPPTSTICVIEYSRFWEIRNTGISSSRRRMVIAYGWGISSLLLLLLLRDWIRPRSLSVFWFRGRTSGYSGTSSALTLKGSRSSREVMRLRGRLLRCFWWIMTLLFLPGFVVTFVPARGMMSGSGSVRVVGVYWEGKVCWGWRGS